MSQLMMAWMISLIWTLPIMNGMPGETFTPDGKSVLIVEAYFNTCPYCNQNTENVDALATKFKNEARVKVLDVGIDKKGSDYVSWISKHQPNHPVLMDSNKVLIGQLGTTAYPSTYVIGCSGDVVFKSTGVWSLVTKNRLESSIAKALEDCK